MSLFGRVLFVGFGTLFLLVLFAAGTVAGIVYSYSQHLPDISKMADFQPSRSTHVYARDGSLLANLYRQNRTWVPISGIPQQVRNAFIATEDQHFYTHHGIDAFGIVRAAIADYRHEEFQGASTITQQLARKLFLSNELSLSRKVQEALLAIEIERYYTKDEILERYLNLIYFGSGAYGIQAAAHTYFGEDVSRLSLAQAALLAGLPAAPSDYSPYVNLARSQERQRHVLERMESAGYITPSQAADAQIASLGLIGERPSGLQSFAYPYFTTYVIAQLEQTFGRQAVYEGGYDVDTTLDPRMQRAAQEAVDWGVGRAKAEGIGAHQAALVAIRPSTGEILAMVGGAGGFRLDNQFNRAWQALRQPGSSFKLYVYTTAIDSGMPPNSVIDDAPVSYPMGDGTTWSPLDDDGRYLGPITLRYALAQSRNVVAVRLAEQLGIDRVVEYAHRMGVRAKLDPVLSLALGSSVVSVVDQATGYATIANQGVHVDPSAIRMVRDSLGTAILDNRFPQETEVVSSGTAYVITTMLESVIKEGTGYPNADIGRPAAGKTGTTSNFRDAWFVGFTPDLVAAVWLGNDDYSRMNESYGGNIPARTWARFMKAALAGTPKHDFTMPGTEVVKVPYCGTPKKFEYFLTGTQTGPCASPTVYNPRRAAAYEAGLSAAAAAAPVSHANAANAASAANAPPDPNALPVSADATPQPPPAQAPPQPSDDPQSAVASPVPVATPAPSDGSH
jgi:penicillin-binding protein 1A